MADGCASKSSLTFQAATTSRLLNSILHAAASGSYTGTKWYVLSKIRGSSLWLALKGEIDRMLLNFRTAFNKTTNVIFRQSGAMCMRALC